MVAMIDHLSIQCADVAASAAFYDTVLATVGGSRIMDFGEVIGYGVPPMPDFWIGPRATGDGFRESHIAFSAPDRAAVRAFFDAAVGGRRRGAPRAAGVARVPPDLLRRVRRATPTATTSRRSATRPNSGRQRPRAARTRSTTSAAQPHDSVTPAPPCP